MTKLIIIRAGQTEWHEQGRLAGDTDLALSEIGHRQAVADARTAGAYKPAAVRCGSEGAAVRTAAVIADELGVKTRTIKALREMNLGTWQGLRIEEFRERFAKVYRQWRSDPTSVTPPDGEPVSDAQARLLAGLGKPVKRYDGKSIVVVVGSLAHAILRCRLIDNSYAPFWDYYEDDARITPVDLSAVQLEKILTADSTPAARA
jgi:probable phosphoglycerate mutase